MIYYIKCRQDNIIDDIITKETQGYTQINIDLWRFKYQIHNGCYRYVNDEILLDKNLETLMIEENAKIEEEKLVEEVLTNE